MKTKILLLSLLGLGLQQTSARPKPFAKVKHQPSIGFTKTTTQYLPQLTLRNWWSSGINDWTEHTDTSHNVYDSHGRLIEENTTYNKNKYSYDAKGHEIQHLSLIFNGQTETWDSAFLRTNTYDVNGNSTSYMSSQYNNGIWEILDATRNTNVYNNQNQLSQLTSEYWVSDTTYQNDSRMYFTYNNNGEPTEVEIMYWDEEILQFVQSERYSNIQWHQWSNDLELSLLSKIDLYRWADSLYVLESRVVYTYDSHNNETEYYSEDWDGTNWTKSSGNKNLITYNNDGAMVQRINQWFNQDSGYYINQIKEVYSDFITYTGIQNQTSQTTRLAVYPNPATSIITIEATPEFTTETIAFYNLMGQNVLTNQIHSGLNTIDVSVLPKGIYIYKTQSGINGKLVIE